MKKIFLSIIFFFLITLVVQAQEKINAGLVSDIWYDQLEITQDMDIKIYTAFYNQSTEEFKGKIIFRIGDNTLSTKDFSVDPKETKVLNESWRSVIGKHKISIEVSDGNLEFDSKYIEKILEVKKKTVLGNLEKVEGVNSIIENIKTVVKNIDESANTIADNLENKKVSNNTDISNTSKPSTNSLEDKKEEKNNNSESEPEPEILGASIERFLPENNKSIARVYDASIDGISWVIRNWQWAALALFVLFVIFIRRKIS